jgi:hypothetical protein
MSTIVETPDQPLIPEGEYDGTLNCVTDVGFKDFGFGLKDHLKLEYVVEATGQPVRVSSLVTKSLHRKSNLSRHVSAWIYPQPVPRRADVSKFVGAACRLKIAPSTKKDGRLTTLLTYFLLAIKGRLQIILPIRGIRKLRHSSPSRHPLRKLSFWQRLPDFESTSETA